MSTLISPMEGQSSIGVLDSVRSVIDNQAWQHSDDTFLIEPETKYFLSFQELQRQARAVARYLDNHDGVSHGDSVAYAMHNGHGCAAVLLGIMYGGYRAVAINLIAGPDVIAYVLAHSQTTMVFTQSEHAPLIESALASDAFIDDSATSTSISLIPPSVLSVDRNMIQQLVEIYGNGMPDVSVKPSDDALLMYTSGTTGTPKGVTLSHANIIAGGQNVIEGHLLSALDRALCVLPLYHINGLCVTLLAPLVAGGSLVVPQRFSTRAFWRVVDEYRCSWFSVVPTQIAYLLRDADTNGAPIERREHLRFGRSASAPLSPDVHGAFEKRFCVPLIETMGLTETAAQILTNPLPPAKRKLGSPGCAVGDEVIIVDAQLQALPTGHEGELLVRGANVMQRYFRNPTATSEALVNDGWLRTGDLGRKDDEGYIFITGRLKELIIKGGENIAPREIDDALYQHSDVVEAAAFACQCNDYGQRVEAAVVLKESSPLREADLLEACLLRVGKFKCPDRIHFLDELPKGPSGKIQRSKVLKIIRADDSYS